MVNWKVFWILLAGCIFGVICVIPYSLTIQAESLKELPIPLHVLLPFQIVQNTALFAVAIIIGLYFAGKTGLGAPVIERWARGERAAGMLRAVSSVSIALGAAASVLVIALDLLFYHAFPGEPIYAVEIPQPPAWQGFLASFYGGINEEVLDRLFIMSLLAWIFTRMGGVKRAETPKWAAWPAIILTAIIFGLLHLPSTAALAPITPFITARAVILNGIAGIAFGWLYWRMGLESAMIGHFTCDIILHAILPLLI